MIGLVLLIVVFRTLYLRTSAAIYNDTARFRAAIFGINFVMDNLHQLKIVILLLIAVLALTAAACKLAIPYSILLVLGSLVLCFIPGLPATGPSSRTARLSWSALTTSQDVWSREQ